jgi:hypothetical protein
MIFVAFLAVPYSLLLYFHLVFQYFSVDFFVLVYLTDLILVHFSLVCLIGLGFVRFFQMDAFADFF